MCDMKIFSWNHPLSHCIRLYRNPGGNRERESSQCSTLQKLMSSNEQHSLILRFWLCHTQFRRWFWCGPHLPGSLLSTGLFSGSADLRVSRRTRALHRNQRHAAVSGGGVEGAGVSPVPTPVWFTQPPTNSPCPCGAPTWSMVHVGASITDRLRWTDDNPSDVAPLSWFSHLCHITKKLWNSSSSGNFGQNEVIRTFELSGQLKADTDCVF